jgi:hypothetical protein
MEIIPGVMPIGSTHHLTETGGEALESLPPDEGGKPAKEAGDYGRFVITYQ